MFASFCVKNLLGAQKVAHDSFYVDPTQERNLIMNFATATTAELVAFYNAAAAQLGQKPVARFSDRKTAEARCAKIAAELPVAAPVAAAEPVKAEYQRGHCPACGNSSDITCGTVIERHGKQELVREHEALCHGCGHEFNYDSGKPLKARKVAANQGAAVAASWAKPGVREARALRHAVLVAGRGQFDSVAKAFAALNLPSNKIIRTRAALVAGNRVTLEGFEFSLAV
jgi:hypothetical protein